MAEHRFRFEDGAAYDRMMGAWSRLVGAVFLDWVAPRSGLRWIRSVAGAAPSLSFYASVARRQR